jgi:hypothetical protein
MNRSASTRATLVLLAGVAIAFIACGAAYWSLTANHRAMLRDDHPELAWLQRQFNLSPEEFERISTLHRAYLPYCQDLCERVERHHDEIRRAIQQSTQLTPELEALLEQAARVRIECQRMMLQHFFAVSRAMSPEQGRRYLLWVQEKTFHMDHEGGAPPPSESAHGSPGHRHHGQH